MLTARQHNAILQTILLAAILLPLFVRGVRAAPQGKELYAEGEGATLDKLEQSNEKRQSLHTKVELHIHINDVKDKEVATEAQQNEKCATGKREDDNELEHHIQIREAGDEPPCGSGADKEQRHKIKARQTEVDDSVPSQPEIDFTSDELVTSLIRQRNDFIAAAGVAQPHRPVQVMRSNMNSGL